MGIASLNFWVCHCYGNCGAIVTQWNYRQAKSKFHRSNNYLSYFVLSVTQREKKNQGSYTVNFKELELILFENKD